MAELHFQSWHQIFVSFIVEAKFSVNRSSGVLVLNFNLSKHFLLVNKFSSNNTQFKD